MKVYPSFRTSPNPLFRTLFFAAARSAFLPSVRACVYVCCSIIFACCQFDSSHMTVSLLPPGEKDTPTHEATSCAETVFELAVYDAK